MVTFLAIKWYILGVKKKVQAMPRLVSFFNVNLLMSIPDLVILGSSIPTHEVCI